MGKWHVGGGGGGGQGFLGGSPIGCKCDFLRGGGICLSSKPRKNEKKMEKVIDF